MFCCMHDGQVPPPTTLPNINDVQGKGKVLYNLAYGSSQELAKVTLCCIAVIHLYVYIYMRKQNNQL